MAKNQHLALLVHHLEQHGSSMYGSLVGNSDNSQPISESSRKNTDDEFAPPPKDIDSEDAGMTTLSVMGPTSPSQSLANTASAGSSLNVSHKNAGLTTADLKPIYCPAIPYNKKKRKQKHLVIKR